MAAASPGSGVFVPVLYDDPSGVPVRFDYLLVRDDGLVQLERLRNRAAAP